MELRDVPPTGPARQMRPRKKIADPCVTPLCAPPGHYFNPLQKSLSGNFQGHRQPQDVDSFDFPRLRCDCCICSVFVPSNLQLIADIVSAFKSAKYKYPPGPKPLPIIGNMHQLPQGQLGKWAQGLAKEYGEMFTIKIGGQRWVFLTSTRTIKDLLEKRAAVTRIKEVANDRSTAHGLECRWWGIPCLVGRGKELQLLH